MTDRIYTSVPVRSLRDWMVLAGQEGLVAPAGAHALSDDRFVLGRRSATPGFEVPLVFPYVSVAGRAPLPPVSPITDRAMEAMVRGWPCVADDLFRLAFARGESHPLIDRAIEDDTRAIMESGFFVTLSDLSNKSARGTSVQLSSPERVRGFLEGRLGSRISLSDIVALMDIGRPVANLVGVKIRHLTSMQGYEQIGIEGRYDRNEWHDPTIGYHVRLVVRDGMPEISKREIWIGAPYRRLGFGARSLHSLAIFAKKHGADGWGGNAENQGRFAWLRLGGKVEPYELEPAIDSLRMLEETGVVEPGELGLDRMDHTSVSEIMAVSIGELDDDRMNAFQHWLWYDLRFSSEEIDALRAPYPVGQLALANSTTYFVRYEPDEAFDFLSSVYLPSRIWGMDGTREVAAREGEHLLADIGLVTEYLRGRKLRDRIEYAHRGRPALSIPRRRGPGPSIAGAAYLVGAGGRAAFALPHMTAGLRAVL